MEPRKLTVTEVAHRLQVEPKTVYRLIRAGKLPAFKVGTLWRINEEDFEAFAKPETPKRQPRNQRERIAHLARLAS